MVLGLFGGDKPTEKNIAKQVLKVKERYAQPEYRRAAMEKLLEWGTPEALYGLLGRFSVVVQSPHWDEEEKRWLVDELVELGEPARAALSRFLQKENNIAFAAKALGQLSSKETFIEELCSALSARSPEDYRSAQAKQDLIHAIAEIATDASGEVLIPYLDDHSDDVQCTAIEAVEKIGLDSSHERLATMLTEDMHSARVLRAAAGMVSRLSIPIDLAKAIEPSVLEDYVVKDGSLARREPA
jgi:HEAT repeat protein